MKRSETLNTFQDGLIMDLNPLTTPNSVMTNALNATLITYNGNENVLLNDMGNGRVETAKLPEGYIPLGTAELGGIIYIASYNPLTGKSQIGSFPSPERNISSDEISDITDPILNCSLFYGNTILVSDPEELLDAVKTDTIKLELTKDLLLRAGDKFCICSNSIIKNEDDVNNPTLSDYGNTNYKLNINPQLLKLHVVSIQEDGKIVYLDDNLTWYEDGPYYIKNGTVDPESISEYRDVVESNYTVFSSKIPGKLGIIAELEAILNFEVTVNVSKDNSASNDENSIYNLIFNSNWTYTNSDEKLGTINPTGILIYQSPREKYGYLEFKDSVEGRENNGNDSSVASKELENYGVPTKDNTIVTFTIYPVMKYGYLEYLALKITIDFSKIGTGDIKLTEYKYYIEDNILTLRSGFESYPEENCYVDSILFNFYPLNKSNYETINDVKDVMESTNYSTKELNLKNLVSYSFTKKDDSIFGGFSQHIYFDDSEISGLKRDYCYITLITINYIKPDNTVESGYTVESRYYYRILYTNKVFNDAFYEKDDFCNLNLYDYLDLNFTYKALNVSSTQDRVYFKGNIETSDSTNTTTNRAPVKKVNNDSEVEDITKDNADDTDESYTDNITGEMDDYGGGSGGSSDSDDLWETPTTDKDLTNSGSTNSNSGGTSSSGGSTGSGSTDTSSGDTSSGDNTTTNKESLVLDSIPNTVPTKLIVNYLIIDEIEDAKSIYITVTPSIEGLFKSEFNNNAILSTITSSSTTSTNNASKKYTVSDSTSENPINDVYINGLFVTPCKDISVVGGLLCFIIDTTYNLYTPIQVSYNNTDYLQVQYLLDYLEGNIYYLQSYGLNKNLRLGLDSIVNNPADCPYTLYWKDDTDNTFNTFELIPLIGNGINTELKDYDWIAIVCNVYSHKNGRMGLYVGKYNKHSEPSNYSGYWNKNDDNGNSTVGYPYAIVLFALKTDSGFSVVGPKNKFYGSMFTNNSSVTNNINFPIMSNLDTKDAMVKDITDSMNTIYKLTDYSGSGYPIYVYNNIVYWSNYNLNVNSTINIKYSKDNSPINFRINNVDVSGSSINNLNMNLTKGINKVINYSLSKYINVDSVILNIMNYSLNSSNYIYNAIDDSGFILCDTINKNKLYKLDSNNNLIQMSNIFGNMPASISNLYVKIAPNSSSKLTKTYMVWVEEEQSVGINGVYLVNNEHT